MKRWVTICIALIIVLICSFSAFAMEVPTDTVVQNLNGVQQCIKTYTVSPETDPQDLIEEPFEYKGYNYKYASITKAENEFDDEMQHTETVTVETKKKDMSVVLEALPVTVDYDDGKYTGTLYLDHTTIETVASGYTSGSYNVTTTKEYGNLDSNDMSYIPGTAVKDGKTLPLVNVEWAVQGSALVDDVLVPATYKAIATYSDKAYYSTATGYVTTAEYSGTVSCEEISSIDYTITYVGEEIQNDELEQPVENEDLALTGAWLYVAAGLLIAAAAVAAICFLRSGKSKDAKDTQEASGKE